MKRICISILGLLTAGIILCIVIFYVTINKRTEEKQIRTDIEPIYNHFPGLPATENIQWCSRTSKGIGLTNVWVYAFAFFDYDISAEFSQEGNFKDKTDFYFLPENLAGDHSKWRKLEEAGTVFQLGIKDGERMAVSVYLNEAGNIIYLEAVGD